MIYVPPKVRDLFDSRLAGEPIPGRLHGFYRKWLRFYWDFCQKYGHNPSSKESVHPFLRKLSEKKQPGHLRNQAAHAVSIFHGACPGDIRSALHPLSQQEETHGCEEMKQAAVETSRVQAETGDRARIAHRHGTLMKTANQAPGIALRTVSSIRIGALHTLN